MLTIDSQLTTGTTIYKTNILHVVYYIMRSVGSLQCFFAKLHTKPHKNFTNILRYHNIYSKGVLQGYLIINILFILFNNILFKSSISVILICG